MKFFSPKIKNSSILINQLNAQQITHKINNKNLTIAHIDSTFKLWLLKINMLI